MIYGLDELWLERANRVDMPCYVYAFHKKKKKKNERKVVGVKKF